MRSTGWLMAMMIFGASLAWGAPPQAWEPIGLSGYGGMFSPAISPVDPKLMMIHCDMSAAYLSRDGGRSWRMIPHGQLRSSTTCKPAFHPTDAQVIYSAQMGQGLKVSRDGGQTWQRVPGTPDWLTGEIALDPGQPQRMLVGDRSGVYLSQDEGKSWTACTGPTGQAIAFHFDQSSPLQQRVIFAATSQGIWRSDDGGKSWAAKTQGLPWIEIRGFSGGSGRDGLMLYCSVSCKLAEGKLAGGVFRSRDKGESWESAMGEGINQDTQAADEWSHGPIPQYTSVLTTDSNPQAVWAFNTNTGVWPPHHTACYRSDDAGKTWRATFYPDPRFKEYNVEPEVFAVGTRRFSQSSVRTAINPRNPDQVITLDASHAFYTEDGGKSWKAAHIRKAGEVDGETTWTNTGLVVTTTWNYYIDPFDPQKHYIAYTDIGFARSLDAGKTWIWWDEKNQPPWRNTTYELAFEPKQQGKIWGAFSNTHDIPNGNIILGRHSDRGNGGVGISLDGGKSWQPSNQGLPASACVSVALDPKSPVGKRTLYASMFNNGVYKSTDDGKTWAKASEGLGDAKNMRTCRLVLHEDGTLFVLITAMRDKASGKFLAEGVGLWRSTDGAKSWQMVNQSQPWLWPKDVTIDPKDSRIIYVGACDVPGQEQGGLHRSTDGGATWQRILRQGPQHFGAYLHPSKPGWIYATLTESAPGAGLWLSKDNGRTFAAMNGLPFANAQRVTVDPTNPQVIYVTTFGGSVWKGPAEE